MEKILAKQIVDFNPDLNLHKEYSGRGMFGNTTFAISGEYEQIMEAVSQIINDCFYAKDNSSDDLEFQQENEELFLLVVEFLGNQNKDSLGFDTIVY